jgi:rare lipoprotein A
MQKISILIFFILLYNIALSQSDKVLDAKVTYYSKKFDGRKTYSGERFNSNLFTAAHKNFPLQSLVKITNPKNNRFVIVRVNDRFKKQNFIDISYIAAQKLDVISLGIAKVKIQLLDTSYLKEYLSQSINYPTIEIRNKELDSSAISDSTHNYYIRIASLKLKSNAEIFINNKLAKEYRNLASIRKTSFHKKPLYKVLIGPYKTKDDAVATLSKLYNKHKDATIIE